MSSCALLPRHVVAAVLGLICISLYGSATTASTPIAAAAPNQLEVKPMAHPFLFFSASDVASLRASASTTRKAQFDRLQAWGKQFAAFEPLATGKLPSNRDVLQVYHENGAAYIFNMSLLYTLTGDPTYLAAARKWFLTFCDYPADTGGNYSVGAYSLAVAAGYDILYPVLSEAERTRARDHLAAIVDRGRKGTETDWWAGLLVHHDHWLPAAGLCIGASAIAAETPGGVERLQFLLDHFRRAIDAVGEDGSWTEGVALANYTWAMATPAFEAIRRTTGQDLFKLSVVRGYLTYRLCQWLPSPTSSPLGDAYIAHHDSDPGGRYNVMGCASSHVLRKLAGELRDGRAQWLAAREEQVDMRNLARGDVPATWASDRNRLQPALHAAGWDFLWYDPTVAPRPPAGDLPDHFVFPNQGLTVLRSGWEPSDVVFTFACAPFGGRRARELVLAGDTQLATNMGHIHVLANAFNLFAGGNYLAIGPSYGMSQSKDESTLTIQGYDQRREPNWDARLVRQDFGKDYAYVAGEAAECYPPRAGVKRWVRHVVWLEPGVFVIGDELAAATGTSGQEIAGEALAPGSSTPPATQPEPNTIWRLDYDPEHGNDVTLDQASGAFRLANADGNLGSLVVQFLSPSKIALAKEIVRQPGSNWIAYAQVRASAGDVFKSSPRANILAVMSVLGKEAEAKKVSAIAVAGRGPGAETGEPGVFGAVVNQGAGSRAVVFVRADSPAPAHQALTIQAVSGGKLTWLLFGLPPDAVFEATSSRQSAAGGAFRHTITVRQGAGAKTSPAGTLEVTSGSAG